MRSSHGFTALAIATLLSVPVARAQQPAPPAPGASATPGADAKPAEAAQRPWPGTFAEGFGEIKRLAEMQQLESAQKVADSLLAPNEFLRWKLDFAQRGGWRTHAVAMMDPLLDVAGWNGLDTDTRAEIWFAKGVIATSAKDRETAEADFWKARGMTSDASLQRDTIYDLGSLALQAGEEARAKLPEISGKPATPALATPTAPGVPGARSGPGAAGGPGAPGGAQAPDPLQVAREQYLLARDRFVERLRDQWQDADTQANVELCLKRLRELDDIEKKRKEEEQKKKDEQQKKDQQKKQDQDKDKQDKDKKDQPDKPDPNGKDDDKKQPDKPKDEDKKKPEDKKPDQPKDEKDKADKDKKKDAQPTEKQDAQMSQEEMTQLLDRLQRIEDEHKKIEAQLRAMRRTKVKKDW